MMNVRYSIRAKDAIAIAINTLFSHRASRLTHGEMQQKTNARMMSGIKTMSSNKECASLKRGKLRMVLTTNAIGTAARLNAHIAQPQDCDGIQRQLVR
jgi:hypothetical protein